jgi:transcriptional regulator with XRE-family HTH domain
MQRSIIQSPQGQVSPDWSPLRAVLKQKGIKQGWLAQQVGVTQVHMSEWCRGKRPIEKEYLPLLAKKLSVRQKDLRS